MNTPVVLLHGVQSKIGKDVVLKVDRLALDRGTLHLLVGANGSGKSSFLRVILGFTPISQGDITWSWANVAPIRLTPDSGSPKPALYSMIGYVPQRDDSLWPHLKVWQHVERVFALKNWPGAVTGKDGRKRVVDDVLRRSQVAPANWERYPAEISSEGQGNVISGGEAKRVSYARAISGTPKVLIFDELEASLDWKVRKGFTDSVLRDFLQSQPDNTAIVVTHDPASWLTGEWRPGERLVWRFNKDVRGEITIERDETAERTRQSRPQETLSARDRFLDEIRALPSASTSSAAEMQALGASLSLCLYKFVGGILDFSKKILTVVGADPTLHGGKVRPILLGVTGMPGYSPDGKDMDCIGAFLVDGCFPKLETPPKIPQDIIPLGKGLIVDLIEKNRSKLFVGRRSDQAQFGDIETEVYCFSADVEEEFAKQPYGEDRSYLELSTLTKSVYLFGATGSAPHQRLVVGIDFLNDCSLDTWQCYFIMQLLAEALKKLY